MQLLKIFLWYFYSKYLFNQGFFKLSILSVEIYITHNLSSTFFSRIKLINFKEQKSRLNNQNLIKVFLVLCNFLRKINILENIIFTKAIGEVLTKLQESLKISRKAII
jgi:hypothetical protein